MCKEHRPRQDEAGEWRYPKREDALKECGLKDILEYIEDRRATVARFVADRPIFEACRGGERLRGSTPRQYWWEQPLGLEDDGPEDG